MRYLVFSLLVFALSACSQCYECTHTVEIISNGQVIEEEATEEFCTATPSEIDAKEAAGFDCRSI
jgi:hypothetical protein